ncbi:acetyltransferase [Streptomyces sp. G44]|uniref:GNAT family N-acetyltransferase n=1 Tax=Streptomyces sp. G44 TaxID=2807632 RepID=UPI001961B940|nr:GNAT family N-acetyltransferase [Streptomyces sp. G44]MBM7167845.1 acetyltransferase [Streptomyces sp. G44]
MLRPLDPLTEAELVHGWVTHPRAASRLLRGTTLTDVERAYMAIAASGHHEAFLGLYRGVPSFLMERYDPAYGELAGLYEPRPGDVGLHFLTAPPEVRVPGFTRGALTAVLRELFADPAVERVVTEPDVRDTAVLARNASVGFRPETVVQKPEREALLSFCTRERFLQSLGGTALRRSEAAAPSHT